MMQEPTGPEVQQAISRQFIFIAVAAAPAFAALALVRFSPFPVVGWVLLVVGVVACAIVIARVTPWFRAEHPALRQIALITTILCITSPVIAILAILFLPA